MLYYTQKKLEITFKGNNLEVLYLLMKNFTKNVENASCEIENGLRVLLPSFNNLDKAAITLVLYVACKQKNKDIGFSDAVKFLPEDIQNDIFCYTKVDVTWNDVNNLLTKFEADIFLQVLLNIVDVNMHSGCCNLPISLIKLVESFLNIEKNMKGLQLYSGSGNMLINFLKENIGVALTGIEIEKMAVIIAKFKAFALDNNIDIIENSPIDYCIENRNKGLYDFVISTHPFGLRVRMLSDKFPMLNNIYPALRSGTAADWVCSLLSLDCINSHGKVIAFLSEGCMFTNQDKEVRKYLVHNGFIEAVIDLPARMYPYTGIKTVMLVLSKGNTSIKMVDASEMFTLGRRQNEFSEENIMDIMNAYNNIGEKSATVTIETLAENDYILLPTRFIRFSEVEIKNGKPLEEVADFGRSVVISAAELDKLSVDENYESNNYYLRLSEVHDGIVDKHLPKISKIEKKQEKYLLRDNDIILSRNGVPFKVALFSAQDGTNVLPVGNLLIIRANKEKINPVYLKAYLESENGVANLSRLLTGVAMQVISLERLKKMIVPVPDMSEQNKIAEQYLSIMDELEILHMKLINTKDRLRHVFDNTRDGD